MVVSLLLAALLSEAPPDIQKFDCDKQCDDLKKTCAFACEQESKHAAKSGEAAPMDCKTLCDGPIKRCEQMCVQFKQTKSRTSSIKASDMEAEESGSQDHEE